MGVLNLRSLLLDLRDLLETPRRLNHLTYRMYAHIRLFNQISLNMLGIILKASNSPLRRPLLLTPTACSSNSQSPLGRDKHSHVSHTSTTCVSWFPHVCADISPTPENGTAHAGLPGMLSNRVPRKHVLYRVHKRMRICPQQCATCTENGCTPAYEKSVPAVNAVARQCSSAGIMGVSGQTHKQKRAG